MTDAQAAEKAAVVINHATALRYRLRSLTPTQIKEGRRAVFEPGTLKLKRYRGRVGEFIGDSVKSFSPEVDADPMQGYVSMVIDCKTKIYRVAKRTGVDASNLTKEVKAERIRRALAVKAERIRRALAVKAEHIQRAQPDQVVSSTRGFESKEIDPF
jgi:hypothetical protein